MSKSTISSELEAEQLLTSQTSRSGRFGKEKNFVRTRIGNRLVGLVVGWIGCLVGGFGGFIVGLLGGMFGWLLGGLVGWLVGQLVGGLVGSFIVCLVGE
jgi:hypothetical protein